MLVHQRLAQTIDVDGTGGGVDLHAWLPPGDRISVPLSDNRSPAGGGGKGGTEEELFACVVGLIWFIMNRFGCNEAQNGRFGGIHTPTLTMAGFARPPRRRASARRVTSRRRDGRV